MQEAEVIVIGSGPAGAHAAAALVEKGVDVLMLDGGQTTQTTRSRGSLTPADAVENFEDVRRNQQDQWRLFLGEDLSAIPVEGMQGGLSGGQTSGNRSYVVRHTEAELPLETQNAQVIQSLAVGGLAAAWGGTSAFLGERELRAMGLDAGELAPHYEVIAKRIGVSGPATHYGVQPPLRLDHHAERILGSYKKKESEFARENISVLEPHAAVLTQDLGERKALQYNDMEYWSDAGRSVYRPRYTIEELRKRGNFSYVGGVVVKRIDERLHCTEVTTRAIGKSHERKSFKAKRVILAAGAVNSARILLQSRDLHGTAVPFVGKPHGFSACLDVRSIGQVGPRERSSLCQLLVLDERERREFGATAKRSEAGLPSACAQLYSYRSLLLFRLLPSLPLPTPEALRVLSLLTPMLVIADIRFPAFPDSSNTLVLEKSGTVRISMTLSPREVEVRNTAWKRLRRAFRRLGIPSIRNLALPEASSSHYGGTIPIAEEGAHPLTVDRNCKLHGASSIYVADASVFRALSPKPHTLTIMANSNRVGEIVAKLLLN